MVYVLLLKSIMYKKIISLFSLSLILFPTIIVAAPFDAGQRPGVNVNAGGQWLIDVITQIISFLWILFIAFAVIMFIVAGFQFLAAQGEPEGVKKAQKSVLWGSIGVFLGVMAFLLPFIIRLWIFPT